MNHKAQAGEIGHKKVWFVVATAVVLLLIVGFVVLNKGKVLAGKAIATDISQIKDFAEGTAGVVTQLSGKITNGQEITIPVVIKLPLNSETIAFEFTLLYPSDLFTVSEVDSDHKLDAANPSKPGWETELLVTDESVPGKVSLVHGTLNFDKSKDFIDNNAWQIAYVKLKATKEITDITTLKDTLKFESIKVMSFKGAADNLITSLRQPVAGTSPVADTDGDGVSDATDNCKDVKNPDQLDTNKNGIGDACESKCDASSVNEVICGKFCSANTLKYCSAGSISVDINGDKKIDGTDAFIITKIKEAIDSSCGNADVAPCPFVDVGTYVCDDGSFRVDKYHGYTYDANKNEKCPFPNMKAYVEAS